VPIQLIILLAFIVLAVVVGGAALMANAQRRAVLAARRVPMTDRLDDRAAPGQGATDAARLRSGWLTRSRHRLPRSRRRN
jgi:hypothetical protein